MKILTILALTLFSFAANCGEVIKIPMNVKEVRSAVISTGGGEKMIMYAKVFCVMDDGSMNIFLDQRITASSIFGISRWTLPEQIKIVKDKEMKNKISWESEK